MKAISLWQPWASLWCSPAKIHETRHWSISHRGWLAVHAAKRTIDDYIGDDPLDLICDQTFGRGWENTLPRGALIGVVNILDCRPTEAILAEYYSKDDIVCGDFSPNRFGWKRGDFVAFREPLPYRGQQGIFNIPDDVIVAAMAKA